MKQPMLGTARRSMALRSCGRIGTGVLLSLLSGSAVVGAAETVNQRYTWNVVAEARGVSPYAEVPSEQPGGGPFVRAELESTNQVNPSTAFGALGYPSHLGQEGAVGVKSKPGDVYASSGPNSSFGKAAGFAPFGAAGPYVAAEAPDSWQKPTPKPLRPATSIRHSRTSRPSSPPRCRQWRHSFQRTWSEQRC